MWTLADVIEYNAERLQVRIGNRGLAVMVARYMSPLESMIKFLGSKTRTKTRTRHSTPTAAASKCSLCRAGGADQVRNIRRSPIETLFRIHDVDGDKIVALCNRCLRHYRDHAELRTKSITVVRAHDAAYRQAAEFISGRQLAASNVFTAATGPKDNRVPAASGCR